MTIIIGAIHEGYAYIGTDSLWSFDKDFVRPCKTSKFIPVPDDKFLMAQAGQDKFTQIFIRAMKNAMKDKPKLLEIKNITSIYSLVDLLKREVMATTGVGEAENNELPEHDMGLIVAAKGCSKIWSIGGDYSVMEFDDYVSEGAGSLLAEAAMNALARKGVYGREAVEIALKTACELHPYCNEPLEIKTIDLELPSKDNNPE